MKGILSSRDRGFFNKLLSLLLITLLTFSGILVLEYAPAGATTLEETKLVPPEYQPSPEEKIERAYEYSEATGILEETKQELGNVNEKFDPNRKANLKNLTKSQDKNSGADLKQKTREFVDKLAK